MHVDKIYRSVLKPIFKIYKYPIYEMISFDGRININSLIFRKWNKTACKRDMEWKSIIFMAGITKLKP